MSNHEHLISPGDLFIISSTFSWIELLTGDVALYLHSSKSFSSWWQRLLDCLQWAVLHAQPGADTGDFRSLESVFLIQVLVRENSGL
jgi:hypothetical protein